MATHLQGVEKRDRGHILVDDNIGISPPPAFLGELETFDDGPAQVVRPQDQAAMTRLPFPIHQQLQYNTPQAHLALPRQRPVESASPTGRISILMMLGV